MKTQFFLARHGQTQWNVLKKLQGHLDSPMTEYGLEQAKTLAQLMSEQSIDLIISSPLGRAKTTAEICQQHLNIALSFNDTLIERDFGQWQGQLFEDLSDQPHFEAVFYQVTQHAPPKGESGLACAQRFQQALIDIAQTLATNSDIPHTNVFKILIITHGDMLRCFCQQLSQPSFVDAYSQYGNGAVFIVDYDSAQNKFSATQSPWRKSHSASKPIITDEDTAIYTDKSKISLENSSQ